MNLGGWSNTMPVDEELIMISKWMKSISESKSGKTYEEFNAIEYRSQVVAGLNYLIKVQVGENEYVHLQIFNSPLLSDTITITFKGVQGDHKREDPLEPFGAFASK